MAQKEKIVSLPAKRIMYRSPQPVLRRVEKEVAVDRETMDMLRYLGTTLEAKEDDDINQVATEGIGGTESSNSLLQKFKFESQKSN